eukprot:NODE_593_length_5604_cov_0.739691.p8 type:complete len:122 gc:universal NODE_593_length_5604_cov_0.739691:3585-3220(-)
MEKLPLNLQPAKLTEASAGLTLEQQKQIVYQGPKQLPMQGFMLWMMGGTLNIFTIGFLSMLIINTIKGFKTIAVLDSSHKVLFAFAQVPMIALIAWKLNQLQLFQQDIYFENDNSGVEFLN